MKRKFLLFVSLFLAGTLTACDLGGTPANDSSGGNNSGNDSSSINNGGSSGNGGDITLPNTINEAKNKFYQLAQTQGFEITFLSDSEENGQVGGTESMTVGYKDNVLWVPETSAYKKVDTKLEIYNYDAASRTYEFQGETTESEVLSLDGTLQQFTQGFYIGYNFANDTKNGYIASEKSVTFLNRQAKEYTYVYRGAEGIADVKIIFDNETGITLKVSGSAAIGGESSSGNFEVTSFKTCSEVNPPRLIKNGGQGGEQGDVDRFSNKLLTYVRHVNYNIFDGSQLALFQDGKFELSFKDSGFLVVYFGTYTVASSKTSATLVTSQVYKEQSKKYTDISLNWTLNYENNEYTLLVEKDGNSKVIYTASNNQPAHVKIPGSEQGEQGETNNLVGHVFTYVSQQSAEGFINSQLTLFVDGTFEIVSSENGKLVVYLGDYTVNDAQTEARLSAQKKYEEQSNSYTAIVGNWIFTVQANNQYYLAMPAATVIYVMSSASPAHANIPDDPNGGAGQEDERFLVSDAVWADMIERLNVVKMDSNFTARVTSADNQNGFSLYEFDNAKLKYTNKTASGTYVSYKEFVDNGSYAYDQDSTGKWVKNYKHYDSISSYNNSLGIIRVPFEKVTYSSDSHEYVCSSWTDDIYGDVYKNVHIGFDNGKLVKISYVHRDIYFETELTQYGSTSVTFPEIGSGNLTPSQLNDLVRNKVFALDTAGLSGGSQYPYPDKVSDYYVGNKISFFTDDTFEFIYNRVIDYSTGEIIEQPYCLIGTYQVEAVANTSVTYNYVRLHINKVVFNGVLTRDNIEDEVLSVKYYSAQALIRVLEYDATIVANYAYRDNLTPEHIQYSTEPEQPQSKWPAEDIAGKLSKLGFAVTIPAPSSDNDSYITDVTANVADDNSSLTIIITVNNSSNAIFIFTDYLSSLDKDFTVDYEQSVATEELMSYIYFNATKDVKVNLVYVPKTNVVRIIVSEYKETLNPFPASEIAAFFRSNNINARFPNLQMDNVSFEFSEQDRTLLMKPAGNNTAENIIEQVKTIFYNNGLKAFYSPDGDSLDVQFIDANMNYYVELSVRNGNALASIDFADEYMKDYFSMSYPDDFYFDAVIPGTSDNLPEFNIDGAVYQYDCGWEEATLLISMQPGMDITRSVGILEQRLQEFDYELVDGVYQSPNNQIRVSITAIGKELIDVEISFVYEEQDVTYTLVCTNDFDLNDNDALVYVYVWDAQGNYELIWVDYDYETHSITLETTDRWIGFEVIVFASDSEIDLPYSAEGSVNEGVNILYRSGVMGLTSDVTLVTFTVR